MFFFYFDLAYRDAAKQIGEAGAGGAFMGAGFGVGGTAFRGANTAIYNTSVGDQISQTEGAIADLQAGAENLKGKGE